MCRRVDYFCQRADAKGASVATTRTLVLQRSAGNSPNSNLDTLTQIAALLLASGMIAFSLTQTSQKTQNFSINRI